MATKTRPRDAPLEFKEVVLGGEPVGLSIDRDKSGADKGFEKSRLLALKEDGLMAELSNEKADNSVMKLTASAYLPCCVWYNCCFPEWLAGPLCGNVFCCKRLNPCEIRMRRDRWLGVMHALCLAIHTTMAILSYSAGAGKPMEVQIYRVKPTWNNTGRNGYEFDLVPDFNLRIDTVTASFFALSAFFHLVWVVPSITSAPLWSLMTYYVDDCFCPWRFIEYSLSASLMLVGIGMVTALRDRNAMIGVFMLCFTTMLFGILTEMLSRPEKSKLKWQGDPDPVEWAAFNYAAFAAKFRSYIWRTAPHYIGWVPYISAWYVVLQNFWKQLDDLPPDVRDRVPDFVPWAIYGTFVIFSSFSFVQARYQWTAPEHYWRTELHYGLLSATAKLYLGGLLYWNVLLAASFDEGVNP